MDGGGVSILSGSVPVLAACLLGQEGGCGLVLLSMALALGIIYNRLGHGMVAWSGTFSCCQMRNIISPLGLFGFWHRWPSGGKCILAVYGEVVQKMQVAEKAISMKSPDIIKVVTSDTTLQRLVDLESPKLPVRILESRGIVGDIIRAVRRTWLPSATSQGETHTKTNIKGAKGKKGVAIHPESAHTAFVR